MDCVKKVVIKSSTYSIMSITNTNTTTLNFKTALSLVSKTLDAKNKVRDGENAVSQHPNL